MLPQLTSDESETYHVKAAQYSSFGEPADVLTPAQCATPEPADGELLVRVTRSPIHNHDLATIRGVYGVRPQLPAIAGSELCGIVERVGSGVSGIEPGARVTCVGRSAWAQYATVRASDAFTLPPGVSDDIGCQLLAMPMSAVILFDELRVTRGEWIAQNAANGAVGKLLNTIAQAHGVNVLNIVRSHAAAEELQAAGARDVVITEGDWLARAREVTNASPIVRIVDSVAGPQSLDLMKLLAPRGELIVFGGLSGAAMKVDPSAMIGNELTVRGFWMTAWMGRAEPAARAKAGGAVFELAMRGQLNLPVAGRYALDDIKAAVTAAEAPSRGGKILVTP